MKKVLSSLLVFLSRRRCHRGFTLVEVLLAVAIAGIIVAVTFGSLRAVTQTIDSVREKMELTHTGRGALWKISSDLSNTFTSEDADFVSDQEGLGDSARRRLSFNSVVQSADGDSVKRIEYRLSGGVLYRSVNSTLFPLVENVDSFELRFFDGADWHEEWDSGEERKLPRMVEMTLGLGGEVFTTAVSIPLSKEKKK